MSGKTIAYPPEPTSLEAAIEEGVTWRKREDEMRWWHGWRYIQIRAKWPGFLVSDYASAVGLGSSSFQNTYRTARVFTPEHVNMFPGIPFVMFRIVSEIAETDIEQALELLENAYDTPGITIGQFEALVHPFRLPAHTVPPLHILGHLLKPHRQGDKIEVVVMLDANLQDWGAMFEAYPLIGKPVEVTIKMPKAAM